MKRHWERGDYVELTLYDRYKVHVVAADHPDADGDPEDIWLVVADENDWNHVGTFESTDYVESHDPSLLYRGSDRAVAADSTPAEPVATVRGAVLREAESLITGDRNKSYGSPVSNFSDIAELWNIQFGHGLRDDFRFKPAHVAQAMAQVKLARMRAQSKKDNWVDLAGYAGCGYECDVESGDIS